MKVCVLQADYEGSTVPYQEFDPPRNLSELLPGSQVDHLFLTKSTVYRQLRLAARGGYDIFVNLCEGYLDWDVPSLDVIWCLELLNLPYTGPSPRLYDPSKLGMKCVAHLSGVKFPAFFEAEPDDSLEPATQLRYPLFVKPAQAGDSLGVDLASYVTNYQELEKKCQQIWADFGRALIEEYIPGRECTVLLAAGPDGPIAWHPIEFHFPAGSAFKTYQLKVEEHHPGSNLPVLEVDLAERLRQAAVAIFLGFRGEGYARLDFRVSAEGTIYFLDINFACSIFYAEGHEGSADYVLKHDPGGPQGFLRAIIADGLARHGRRQPDCRARLRSEGGLGLFALRDIAPGEVIRVGEEAAILATGADANAAYRGPALVCTRAIDRGSEVVIPLESHSPVSGT